MVDLVDAHHGVGLDVVEPGATADGLVSHDPTVIDA
jgi:hypothetical protein